MRGVRGVAGVVLVLMVAAPAVFAQPPQSPPPAAATAQRPPTQAEVQGIIDGWVLVQAQAALRLTDAQFPAFVMRLKALQDGRRRNQRRHAQLVMEIAKLTGPAATTLDEAQVREKLKALDDLEATAFAEQRKALQDLDQALTLRQQARLRVLLDNVERRMFEFLQRARGAGRGGRGQ